MSTPNPKHIAVLTFPFGSHVHPLLNLIIRLSDLTPTLLFSVLLTAKSTPNFKLPHNIKLYFINDGLPENHVSCGNPVEKVNFFLKSAHKNFKNGIKLAAAESGKEICCIISDTFLTFVDELAKEINVPWIAFWVSVPYTLSAHFHSEQIHQFLAKNDGCRIQNLTLDFIPGLSLMRTDDIPDEILMGESGSKESLFANMLNQIGVILSKAEAIVVQFYQELDQTHTTSYLKSIFNNVFYVGSLSIQFPRPSDSDFDFDSTGCLVWLDRHKSKSVIYIGFGTVSKLPESEILEMAEALTVVKIPFIWSMKNDCKAKLPRGFVEKTKLQGKIVSWAPQAEILRHNSIGVFLSHGGTNSVLEALVNEVPLICRPFFGDHLMNAQMVEVLWGIGVRFENDVITKNEVIKSLEIILGQEKGKKMRENIEGLKRVVLKASEYNGSVNQDLKALVDVISRSSLIHFIDVHAWPLCAFGYPLYASIRAIETKSNSETEKLVTYWILFSLISLFEYAFDKILLWLPIWTNIKLIMICWFTIPHFDGALYVYKHFVRPCLSMNSRIVILWVNNGKYTKWISNSLVEGEKYAKENGVEAIEKLIPSKEGNTATEMIDTAKKKELAMGKQVSLIEPNFSQTEGKNFPNVEIKELSVVAEAAMRLSEVPETKYVQREWTCVICQVITSSETTLKAHLQGKRHKANYEELRKAKNPSVKNKGSSPASVNHSKQKITPKKGKFCCKICNIWCSDEAKLVCHYNGSKHLARVQELRSSLFGINNA